MFGFKFYDIPKTPKTINERHIVVDDRRSSMNSVLVRRLEEEELDF